jgi:ATP-dependent protease ClpP protease subunit
MGKELAVNYKLDKTMKIKEYDPLYYLIENGLDIENNQIYLMGVESYTYGAGNEASAEPGVEFIMANRFIKNLDICMRVNAGKPLVIRMKTCGGEWTEGMAIYDAIRAYPYHVTILSYTHARSMSSLIFQAGNKRVMMPNSYFMFHDGTTAIDGTVKTVRSYVEFEKKVADPTMLKIYSSAMKRNGKFKDKTVEYIQKWLRKRMDEEEDVYLTPQETIELGLADEIFDANWARLTEYNAEQESR